MAVIVEVIGSKHVKSWYSSQVAPKKIAVNKNRSAVHTCVGYVYLYSIVLNASIWE